ncbi:Uncharacterised protein [uncultured archaeon]|nr:Uncharacterised protein [uncultured archaeon]
MPTFPFEAILIFSCPRLFTNVMLPSLELIVFTLMSSPTILISPRYDTPVTLRSPATVSAWAGEVVPIPKKPVAPTRRIFSAPAEFRKVMFPSLETSLLRFTSLRRAVPVSRPETRPFQSVAR